ncbi:hypothetical protein FKM82_019573 [Ascaphus truei]
MVAAHTPRARGRLVTAAHPISRQRRRVPARATQRSRPCLFSRRMCELRPFCGIRIQPALPAIFFYFYLS